MPDPSPNNPAPTQSPPHFTPCFDWVVRATGDSTTALAYGIIWRYAQMRGTRCYASCEHLSSELGWTRQRIMRHLRTLLSLRLITCVNPLATGVPREYVPISEEQWDTPSGADSQVRAGLKPAPATSKGAVLCAPTCSISYQLL